MVVTDEAVILYDALRTAFDVQPIGGGLTQKKNTLTGEFQVDRSMCPLVLCPTLQVTDPNEGDKTHDRTAMMIARWYRVTTSGTNETETEITSTNGNDDYYLSGRNLTIQANIEPGAKAVLRVKMSYVNPHTNDTLREQKDFVLSTESYVEFNPALEVDIPNYSTVSPFLLRDNGDANDNYLRTVRAKFFAGTSDISTNSRMVYVWEKKDGTTYRAITASDVEVVSASGRTMVLDLRCIKRAKYRVTAYHADFAQTENRRSRLFTINRQMSGYTLLPQCVRGKFLKKDTPESEEQAVLTVNSNVVDDPLEYFRIGWTFYLQNGTARENEKFLGYGVSATAGRSLSGYDKNKRPTFAMEYNPLSEYDILEDDDGNPIEDDDSTEPIIGQVTE